MAPRAADVLVAAGGRRGSCEGAQSAAGVLGPGVRPAGGDPHTAGPSDMNTVKRPPQPGFPQKTHTQEGGGLENSLQVLHWS